MLCYSLNKYILSAYYVPDTVLSLGPYRYTTVQNKALLKRGGMVEWL